MFFVFDGIDGSGKSTQLQLFAGWLEEQGREVVVCKDPGSTMLGEQLRRLLLDRHQTPIAMRTEMLLFTTARTQLVEEVVRPALAAGKTIVLDRYILSTVVYQGYAGELDPQDIWTVNQIATGGLIPDVTFVFDLPPDKAMTRLFQRENRSLDRLESRGLEYFSRVRDGFLTEAERWHVGVEVIDADPSVEAVQANVRELASLYLNQCSS